MAPDNPIQHWLAAEGGATSLLVITDEAPSLELLVPTIQDASVEYISVPAEGKLQVKQIQDLLDQLQTRPLTQYRLVWIPDAHRLLPEAGNALLKTLEDTTRANRFLLTTPYPGRILATIRSRCQIIRQPRTKTEIATPKLPVFDPKRKTALEAEEAGAIAVALQRRITDGSASPAITRSLMRLRDYYKAASQGVGQRAASDALLASLPDDVY